LPIVATLVVARTTNVSLGETTIRKAAPSVPLCTAKDQPQRLALRALPVPAALPPQTMVAAGAEKPLPSETTYPFRFALLSVLAALAAWACLLAERVRHANELRRQRSLLA
jgi:hypothetical protein